MNKLLLLPLAALAGACTVAVPGPAPVAAGDDSSLAEALAGRTAGDPVSCVRQRDLRNSRAYGDGTILFDGPGSTVYVNNTRDSCPTIRPWHAIRYRTIGTNVCAGELIRVLDPQTGVEYGGCTLGEFTPYRRTG
ncbi:MAG: hypothetical protein M3N07_09360 [Pseudomonadota bacterium]|nr:hypothetical protein [Pseudomonadota bacterium]